MLFEGTLKPRLFMKTLIENNNIIIMDNIMIIFEKIYPQG